MRLTQNHLQIAFGILGIPICFGLLRLSRAWRTCAIVFLCCSLFLAPLVGALALCGAGSVTFGVFGFALAQVHRGWFVAAAALLFLLSLWQYRVLVRPGVRRLFLPETGSAASPEPVNATTLRG